MPDNLDMCMYVSVFMHIMLRRYVTLAKKRILSVQIRKLDNIFHEENESVSIINIAIMSNGR